MSGTVRADAAGVAIQRRRGAVRRALLGASALVFPMGLVLGLSDARANPQGGTVVEGEATISAPDASTTVIDQTSNRVVIDWTSFDIDPGETTRFDQPGSDSVALNRVTMGAASQIRGSLEANGMVFLVNPAGIVFGANASVDVHGLVATTSDIDNAAFMDGDYSFSVPSNVANAEVVNNGTITVGEAGLAALVSQSVRNNGVIAARLAKVVLAGTETFVIDLNGDGLLSFAAPPTPGEELPSVTNPGMISAEGGYVLMTAETAAGLLDTVISMSGVIEADSVGMQNGEVVLTAVGGEVDANGTFSLQGDDAGETGGSLRMAGQTVDYNATTNVTGSAGSGSIELAAVGGLDVDGTLTGQGATLALAGTDLAVTGFGFGIDDNRLNSALAQDMDVTLESAGSIEITRDVDGTGNLTLEADTDIELSNGVLIDLDGGALTAQAGLGGTGDVVGAESARIDVTDAPVSISAAGDIRLGGVAVTDTGGEAASLALDAGAAIVDVDTDDPLITLDGSVPLSLTAADLGDTAPLDVSVVNGASSLALTTRAGDGGIDLNLNGDVTSVDVTLAQTEHGVDIDISNGDKVDIAPGDTVSTLITADLSASGAPFTWTQLEAGADLVITTGTLVVAGDTVLSTPGDLIVGDGDGVAVEVLGNGLTLGLEAGGAIVSDGGLIDLGATNFLSLSAGTTIGSEAVPLPVLGGSGLAGTAGGTVYLVQADGGLLPIGTVGLLTGLTTSAGSLFLTADDMALNAVLSAPDSVVITPFTDGTNIALNDGATGLSLNTGELGQIATALLVIDAGTGAITALGNGAIDLAAAPFDLTLIGDSITFADTGTLTLRDGALARLTAATVLGGGTAADLATAGGSLLLDTSGDVTLRTRIAQLAGTAGGLSLVNEGDLAVALVDAIAGLTTTGGASLTAEAGALDLTALLTTGGATTLTAQNAVTFGAMGGLDASGHTGAVGIASLGAGLDLTQGTALFASNDLALSAAGDIVAVLDGLDGTTLSLSALAPNGLVDVTHRAGEALRLADLGGGANGILAGTTVTLTTDGIDIAGPVVAGGTIDLIALTDTTDILLGSGALGFALDADELNRLTTSDLVTLTSGTSGAIRIVNGAAIDITSRTWSELLFDTPAVFTGGALDADGVVYTLPSPVTVTGNARFRTDAGSGGARIAFADAVMSDGLGAWAFVADAGMGNLVFDADIGTPGTRLGSVSLTGGAIWAESIFAGGAIDLAAKTETVFGTQSAPGVVTVSTESAPVTVSGSVSLASDLDLETAADGGPGGDISLETLTTNGLTVSVDAGPDGAVAVTSVTGGGDPVSGTVDITRAGTVLVDGTVSADLFALRAISTAASVTGAIDLAMLIVEASDAVVSLTGGGTVQGFADILAMGGVTIGGAADYLFADGLRAVDAVVSLNASIEAGGQGIEFADTMLTGSSSLITFDNAPITLGAVTGAGFDLTLSAPDTGTITVARFAGESGGVLAGTLTLGPAGVIDVLGDLRAAIVDLQPEAAAVTVAGLLEADTLTVAETPFSLSLLNGARVRDRVVFAQLGDLTLGDAADDPFAFSGGFEVLTAVTSLAGLFQTDDASIILQETVLGDDVSIFTQGDGLGADITVSGPVDGTAAGDQDMTIIAGPAGSVLFERSIGGGVPLGLFTASGGMLTFDQLVANDGIVLQARDPDGAPGLVTLNSRYETLGGDLIIDANINASGDIIVDTAAGEGGNGSIILGTDGSVIAAATPGLIVDLLAGGTVLVEGRFDEAAGGVSQLDIRAGSSVELAGGVFSGDVTVLAGASGGEPGVIPGQSILVSGPLTVGGNTVMNATGDILIEAPFSTVDGALTAGGDITIRDLFTVDRLLMVLGGTARTEQNGFLSIQNEFVIGGLTDGVGASDLEGEVRGFRSGEAAAFAKQLPARRSDDFLFNQCVIGVGCFQLDRSAIVIRSYEIIVAPYEEESDVSNIRFSDLGNFELFRRLGLINEWQDDDDEDDR